MHETRLLRIAVSCLSTDRKARASHRRGLPGDGSLERGLSETSRCGVAGVACGKRNRAGCVRGVEPARSDPRLCEQKSVGLHLQLLRRLDLCAALFQFFDFALVEAGQATDLVPFFEWAVGNERLRQRGIERGQTADLVGLRRIEIDGPALLSRLRAPFRSCPCDALWARRQPRSSPYATAGRSLGTTRPRPRPPCCVPV